MKIQLKAHQLTDATIEKVSLVKNGANRRPFAILKAEALPDDPALLKVADKVAKMFRESAPQAKVTAIYVNKDHTKTAFPILKDAGFRVEAAHAALIDGCVVLKQDGYDPAATEGSVVAISEQVAVQFDRVIKDFCSWSVGTDFNQNLQNMGFYPGTWLAFDTLRETIYAIMNEAHSPEEAVAPLDAALKAFSKHVLGLAKTLPVSVFKAEQKLASDFETPTVASTEPVSKSEGAPVKKNQLSEAVAGDLAGLFKNEDAAADTGATQDTETVTGTTEGEDATAAADAAAAAAAASAAPATGSEEAPAPADAAATAATGDEAVAKGAIGAEEILKAMKDTVGPLVKAVSDLTSAREADAAANAKVLERLDAIEKQSAEALTVAKSAVSKADNTVVVHKDALDLGSTLHTMHGHQRVTKSNAPQGDAEDDVWAGLMPGLDALQARARGE